MTKKKTKMVKKSQKFKTLKKHSRFSSHQLAVFGLIFAVVGGIVIWRSLAASPNGKNHQTSGPMSLTSETVQWNRYQTNHNCLSEDDYNLRVFSGSVSSSYSTSYQLCGLNTDGFTAGGIGLEAEVAGDSRGNLPAGYTDLTITAPDGTAHHAEKVTHSSQVCQGAGNGGCKTVYSYSYAVCYVPHYFISSDTGTSPLGGGTWQITLYGQISSASLTTRAQMTDVIFQQSYCPPSEQNLSP